MNEKDIQGRTADARSTTLTSKLEPTDLANSITISPRSRCFTTWKIKKDRDNSHQWVMNGHSRVSPPTMHIAKFGKHQSLAHPHIKKKKTSIPHSHQRDACIKCDLSIHECTQEAYSSMQFITRHFIGPQFLKTNHTPKEKPFMEVTTKNSGYTYLRVQERIR